MARILVVEDNPDNLKLFRTLLGMKGHQVEAFTSGDGMLDAIHRHPPDLVLMDIQLPGRDGYALLAEIRDSAHAELRVVALTAHAMAGDRERAKSAGFDDYITKPIDIGSFPGQVARALAGEAIDNRGGA